MHQLYQDIWDFSLLVRSTMNISIPTPFTSPEIEYDETPFFSPLDLSREPSTGATTPGSVGTPFSTRSKPTTFKLLSAVDFRLSNSASLHEKFKVTVAYQDIHWDIHLLSEERDILFPLVEPFNKRLLRKHLNAGKSPISSPLILASAFLQHLCRPGQPLEALRIIIRAFEGHFLSTSDIHNLAFQLDDDTAQINLLKTYYLALGKANEPPSPAKSALFDSAKNKDANVYAVFGGQGAGNLLCLKDLSHVYSIYGNLLDDLIDIAARMFDRLASSPRTSGFFDRVDFDIKRWLLDPKSMPSPPHVAEAPLSFPIIGLLSLAHYCITCKSLGKHPGQLRGTLHGVTGHSQGIIVAVGIAKSGSWEEFYESVVSVLEILFWIGFESQVAARGFPVSQTDCKESIRLGEGQPSSMLGIRGLDRNRLQNLINETNRQVLKKDHVHLALINSCDNMVVSGPPRALRGLNLRLRKFRADENDRNLVIQNRFLPISAPFHSPLLEDAAERVLQALESSTFAKLRLAIGLYHTQTGEDLRQKQPEDLLRSLVQMVMTEMVDWPTASHFINATHVLDFGPGRIGLLQSQLVEGQGIRIIIASDLRAVQDDIGSKEELFSSKLPPPAANWGQDYAPTLVKNSDGKVEFQTRMVKSMSKPPIIVAPKTSSWELIAAVVKAGYHAELKCSDYRNETSFEEVIQQIALDAPPQHSITCSFDDLSAGESQLSLVGKLIRKGLRIEGMTFGSELPPSERLQECIEGFGMKYISFKPSSQQIILEIVKDAKQYPEFTFGLHWNGGRTGSPAFESSYDPILKLYGQIRRCSNIILIADHGFGGSDQAYPYLTGEWSESIGYTRMPFDGVVLGNVMTAGESKAFTPNQELIIQAEGISKFKEGKTRNTITDDTLILNLLGGEQIHATATRGALLWKHFDTTLFSIPDLSKRIAEQERNRIEIVNKINKDFQKPWFAVDFMGNNVDISDMAYLEVLHRLVSLMYIRSQGRWIDPSYEKFILDFAAHARECLVMFSPFQAAGHIEDPSIFLATFLDCYPSAETERLCPADVAYFMTLCGRQGQKAVNFIPCLDENSEIWFKDDPFWQAMNIEAVVNQDVGRVVVCQDPVAALNPNFDDESCKEILDGIMSSWVERLSCDIRVAIRDSSPE